MKHAWYWNAYINIWCVSNPSSPLFIYGVWCVVTSFQLWPIWHVNVKNAWIGMQLTNFHILQIRIMSTMLLLFNKRYIYTSQVIIHDQDLYLQNLWVSCWNYDVHLPSITPFIEHDCPLSEENKKEEMISSPICISPQQDKSRRIRDDNRNAPFDGKLSVKERLYVSRKTIG